MRRSCQTTTTQPAGLRLRRECGGFGGTVDAREIPVALEEVLARGAHLLVGLDAEDAISIVEEELREQARAGADIGDDAVGVQVAFGAQEIQQSGRVAGAIADVVGHAIREALFGVGKSHGKLMSLPLSVSQAKRTAEVLDPHGNWRRKRTSL